MGGWALAPETGDVRGTAETLRQKARLAPEGPGIYIHRDRHREVLYVGKARNLRNRLKSYFYGTERLPERIRQLVRRIDDFDIVLAQNENESLVLEAQFIRSHQPPFNILLRSGKAYPYVRIDPREEWATVKMVRRRAEDGALYFGPYAAGSGLFGVLNVVRKFFPLVKCSPRTLKTIPRPCNYFHMRQCLAPCHMPVDREAYGTHVDAVIALLRGQIVDVRARLHTLMLAASESEDFERAAMYRDQIKAIEELGQAQSVDLERFVDLDLISVFWGSDAFSVAIMGLRNGQVVASHCYSSPYAAEVTVPESEGNGQPQDALRLESLESLLRVFYLSHWKSSSEHAAVCIDDKQGIWTTQARDSLVEFLQAVAQGQDHAEQKISEPQSVKVFSGLALYAKSLQGWASQSQRESFKKQLQRLSDVLYDTARQKYHQDRMLSSQQEQMVVGLQSFLGLATQPSRVECFDISTFQGSETVASQVVFRDGRPHRKAYRRYIIRSIEGQDDFGSLREVMRRRFRDADQTGVPDLVLVDGGEPQLREVRRVLVGMGLSALPVAGIAKARTRSSFVSDQIEQSSERMVTIKDSDSDGQPRTFETRTLRVGSPEYRLVTQLRDEAHRFAITFHRERRAKRSMRSVLDGVPGLGPKRKKMLLQAFPSPKDMLLVDRLEIQKRTGLSLLLVDRVLEVLRTPPTA